MDKIERKPYSNHQYQQVIITFSDDTFAVFTGPFCLKQPEDADLKIVGVAFTEGKEIPNDMEWMGKKDVN